MKAKGIDNDQNYIPATCTIAESTAAKDTASKERRESIEQMPAKNIHNSKHTVGGGGGHGILTE